MSDTATSPKVEQVLEIVEGMTVLELADLVSCFEDKFGVSAAAPVAVAAAAPGADGGAVEEKTEFDVVLQTVGNQKIQVIKVVRQITGLGLKEAKDLVESAPTNIKEGVSKDEAAEIAKKVEEVGATTEVK